MEIRFAKDADIPGIIALLRQVGEVHHRGRPDIFRAGAQKYDEAGLKARLREESLPTFIATEHDRVLGYGMCQRVEYRDHPVMTDFTTLYIDDLCVDEAFRGKGVGSALYAYIRRFAKETGCRSVTLNVWACNESAKKFYEAQGLVPQKIGLEAVLEEN